MRRIAALLLIGSFVAAQQTTDNSISRVEAVNDVAVVDRSDNVASAQESSTGVASWLSAPTIIGTVMGWNASTFGNEEGGCELNIQQRFNCTEVGCEDLVAGYINYIDFFYCTVPNVGGQVFAFLLLLLWMAFLLHLVETTTNDFFCASLTLAVDLLKLSPNVAGVTFLAVGNAACDVIASIAAFATGVPKVGIGTTLGAGIFVTTAVIGVVSFVSDVRLARRSFVRDILFFIGTVIYLLIVAADGYISLPESVGFIIIYIVFVAVVAGGRYIRMLRSPEEDANGLSIGGSTGEEGPSRRLSVEIIDASAAAQVASASGGYNAMPDSAKPRMGLIADASRERSNSAAGASSGASAASASGAGGVDSQHRDMLAALEAARGAALQRSRDKEVKALANRQYFAQPDKKGKGAADVESAFYGGAASASGGYKAPTVGGEEDDGPEQEGTPLDADEDEDEEGGDSSSEGEDGEEDDDGDLGGGSGDASARILSPSEGMTGFPVATGGAGGASTGKKGSKSAKSSGSGGGRSKSFVDQLPAKPSRWTRAFLKTQKEAGPAYAPFQWTKYHKKHLAKELAKRLSARGATQVTNTDGSVIDFIELLQRDPDAAAELAASIGTAVTAAASRKSQPLTFAAAKAAAASAAHVHGSAAGATTGARAPTSSSAAISSTGTGGPASSSGSGASTGSAQVSVPVIDILALLPHETVKPVAQCFTRMKRVFNTVQPWYHKFMHTAELPVQAARKLTVPVLHEGSYRRRLVCIVMPFMCIMFTVILTTHILKGGATSVGGFPYWCLGGIVGACMGVALHFLLPSKPSSSASSSAATAALGSGPSSGSDATVALSATSERESLLASSSPSSSAASASTGGDAHSASSSKQGGDHHGHGGHKSRPWYKKIGIWLAGSNDQPLPKGPLLVFLLVMSFVMALFWLLLIANEIVGTAVFIGKALKVPDVVMGLTVLAVGNSINDLAASLTIARDGYASMAVAGAYAGPMFNVLAGIGLPMLISNAKPGGAHTYYVGEMTPLVIMSYVALLTPLTVTLIWVPCEGWRITHRIGRFLCTWFFLFIAIVIIVGFSVGDSAPVSLGG